MNEHIKYINFWLTYEPTLLKFSRYDMCGIIYTPTIHITNLIYIDSIVFDDEFSLSITYSNEHDSEYYYIITLNKKNIKYKKCSSRSYVNFNFKNKPVFIDYSICEDEFFQLTLTDDVEIITSVSDLPVLKNIYNIYNNIILKQKE